MKIEQVRKIKSIESDFLKLSKSDNLHLSMVLHNTNRNFFSADSESLTVEMCMFDSDLGGVKVSIEAMTPSQVGNLKIILEMLQGSV